MANKRAVSTLDVLNWRSWISHISISKAERSINDFTEKTSSHASSNWSFEGAAADVDLCFSKFKPIFCCLELLKFEGGHKTRNHENLQRLWLPTKKPSKPRYANKWISIKKKVRQNFIVGQPLVAWWPSWPPLSSVRYYPSIIIIIRGNFTFFFSQPAGQTRWIIIPTPTVSKKTLTFFCCNYQ